MIYPTFEEWWETITKDFPVSKFTHDECMRGWNARDAEIADLKRQLRQALAQVEIVDRALGDPGNTSSKVVLDAYVQERVESERKMWQSRESEAYRQALLKRAVEAEKRAEKAESNMAKAVLAESEWWHTRKIPYPNNGTVIDMGAEERLAANRAKVTPAGSET